MTVTYRALGNEGRLGNQLWQIASTLGIAYAMGDDVRLPPWDYMDVFSVPDDFFGEVHDEAVDAIDLALGVPAPHRPYLQDLSLWAELAERIRVLFTPRPEVVDDVGGWCALGPHIGPLDATTAVHVRRTDAVVKQQYGFKVPDMNYYGPAMEAIASVVPTTFLVFSDDIAWCRQHFPTKVGGNPVEFITPELPEPERNYRGDPLGNDFEISDFVLQYLCGQHITANSTFSWWAAWLSGDPAPITPARWGSAFPDHRLFIPSNWRRL